MHGYEVYQRLSAPDGIWQVWRLKQSQLYALLTKLEEKGHLSATLQPQDARPPRKVYALTDRGQAAFLRWLNTPVAHGRQMRLEFLAKLYFAYQAGPDVTLLLIDQQAEICQAWRAELQSHDDSSAPAQPFVMAVEQFRLSQIDAFLAWLATLRQALVTKDADALVNS